MMSLKSVLLMALALLFFAAGIYIFHESTRDCPGREIMGPHGRQANPSDHSAATTSALTE